MSHAASIESLLGEVAWQRLPAAVRARFPDPAVAVDYVGEFTLLALNFGAVLAMLGPVLAGWWPMPSAVVPVYYGPISWVFTAFGAGVFAWSLRNATAVVRL